MKISIITVTFNSQSSLGEAIHSVLSQEVDELEYILVDGGSTDATVEIIRTAAAKDARISWVSEPDKGIADAFNKGLGMATGEWIGILNSDDLYAPRALAAVAAAVTHHPEAMVVHGDMLRLDDSGTPLFILKPADLERVIWRQMPLNHPTMFVSRRAYDRVGNFDEGLRIAMDYDLVLRLYKSGARFVALDRVLAHMRYGGASDNRLLLGLKDVWTVSTREGYPKWKATSWLFFRGFIGLLKNLLRRVGLVDLLKLHPRFRGSRSKRGLS
jgi:glycosyltransferase involved in cell wall biosynthesis